MPEKKSILFFTENRKEEINLVNYFRASDTVVKIAKEMGDFRYFLKSSLFDFVLIDSSVERYSAEILKTLETIKMGYYYLADDKPTVFKNVIQKPYSFRNLVTLIEDQIQSKFNFDQKKVDAYLNSTEYIVIKIEDIAHLKTAPYDYFVKINDLKYVKIARANETVAIQILDNIRAKGVQIIYAKREEYNRYLDLLTRTSLNINTMKVTKEVKMKFLAKTSELLMEQIFTDGLSKELFYNSKQVLDSSINLAVDDENIGGLLILLNDMDQSTYRHSLAVSIYSVLIAKQLNWETEGNMFKLSLGALFSDIGLKAIDPEITKKSSTWLSEEEAKIYQQHPILGAEIMRGAWVSEDIIDIISQHHENGDGTGYPRKLNRTNIHPMAKVVRVAHEFCEQALKSEHNPNPESPEIILKRLYASGSRKFELSLVEALAKAHGFTLANESVA